MIAPLSVSFCGSESQKTSEAALTRNTGSQLRLDPLTFSWLAYAVVDQQVVITSSEENSPCFVVVAEGGGNLCVLLSTLRQALPFLSGVFWLEYSELCSASFKGGRQLIGPVTSANLQEQLAATARPGIPRY